MDISVDALNIPLFLEPEPGSKLTPQLIELIVSKLDFEALNKVRLVCKSWNKMITSPGFWPRNPITKCLLVAHDSSDNLLTVHNPSTRISYSCPCNPLLEFTIDLTESESTKYLQRICTDVQPNELDLICEYHERTRTRRVVQPGELELIGTAGGLLCFRSTAFPNHIVSNPLMETFRVLPSMVRNYKIPIISTGYRVSWVLAAMLLDQYTQGYKLVMTGYCDIQRYPEDMDEYSKLSTLSATQVYDSLSKTWRLTYQVKYIWGSWISFHRSCSKYVLYEGFLFVITLAQERSMWNGALSVMIFSFEEGTWVQQFLESITVGSAYGSLAVSNNELYMATMDGASSFSTINYWKLKVADMRTAWRNASFDQEADSVWQLMRKISLEPPQFPISHVPWGETNPWIFMGQSGCFYFMFRLGDGEDCDTVVIHDIAADTWRTLQFEGHTPFDNDEKFSTLCLIELSFAKV